MSAADVKCVMGLGRRVQSAKRRAVDAHAPHGLFFIGLSRRPGSSIISYDIYESMIIPPIFLCPDKEKRVEPKKKTAAQ